MKLAYSTFIFAILLLEYWSLVEGFIFGSILNSLRAKQKSPRTALGRKVNRRARQEFPTTLRGLDDDNYMPLVDLRETSNSTLSLGDYSFKELDDKRKAPFKPLFIARVITWALRKLVRSRTEYVQGLDIEVSSSSNRQLIRGKVDTIDMKFDKISYANLYVSGGGRIIVKGLELRMRRFLFQNLQSVRKPYVIYADLLLTQQDIINSKFIRNLIQLLVNTILERIMSTNKILSAQVRKVTINERRINAMGTATLLSDQMGSSGLASLDFEVSTGAGIRDEGQTLFLKDIQVVLNPDSLLRTVMPILTTTPIDIDLGEDTRIESLVIANKNVWIRAATVISPLSPFSVAEVKTRALYRYDLSKLLSSLLRLNGGIAMKWRGSGDAAGVEG